MFDYHHWQLATVLAFSLPQNNRNSLQKWSSHGRTSWTVRAVSRLWRWKVRKEQKWLPKMINNRLLQCYVVLWPEIFTRSHKKRLSARTVSQITSSQSLLNQTITLPNSTSTITVIITSTTAHTPTRIKPTSKKSWRYCHHLQQMTNLN